MPYHPSIFEQINTKTVQKSTLKAHGNHGHSGLDACEWRRILTHFNQTFIELCKTIAKLSYTIASKIFPMKTSCRLIPLDKNPGVRPIGIGEVLRQIIGKTITQCIKSDLQNLGKSVQLCLGQKNEIETDAILLIDAENAFNSLNIELALKIKEIICPALHHALANSFKIPQFYMSITRFKYLPKALRKMIPSQWLFTKLG